MHLHTSCMQNCILTNCFKCLYFKITKIDDHFEIIPLVYVNKKAQVVYDALRIMRTITASLFIIL